jgi:uncharacterized membrane protein
VAVLLILPRTRRIGGWAAAALLVAVFPGNVYLAVRGEHPALGVPGERWLHLARLPLQVPLVAWGVWVARRERPGTP